VSYLGKARAPKLRLYLPQAPEPLPLFPARPECIVAKGKGPNHATCVGVKWEHTMGKECSGPAQRNVSKGGDVTK
jgi:hypothetical protein